MKKKISKLINDSKTIVLLSHINPDGDSIGCLLSFYYLLKKMNKEVDIVSPKASELYSFLDGFNNLLEDSEKKYDLAIILDCACLERVGQNSDIFNRCKNKINIDHHISNTMYGDINYVEGNVPACCQVLYYLYKELNYEIDDNIGKALMIGLLTDTGGFRNNNVNKNTYLMAAEMMDIGIDIYYLYDKVIARKSMAQHELMKLVLDRLEFFRDGKIAFSYITKDDFVKTKAKIGDHEGLVNIGRSIDGVEISIFIREDDGYYISFRSNGLIKVNSIAAKFNGGGHDMAAGAHVMMDFLELKNNLIEETKKAIDSYERNITDK